MLYGTDWEVSMPAFIENVEKLDNNNLKITLIHDLLLTDIFSFAKIDTSKHGPLSLKDALLIYEGFNLTDNKSESENDDDWYIEPQTPDNLSNENNDYLSYRQGNYITPKLNIYIQNSTIIKGTFELEVKFYSKASLAFDTRQTNTTNTTIKNESISNETTQRKLEFTTKAEKYAEKYLNIAKGKISKKISFFSLEVPIGALFYVGADASAKITGSIDSNIFSSRGSVASLARMFYNIPKGLITGQVDKTVMDFLPGEAGKISDSSIQLSTNQYAGANLHFIKAGFNLNHFAKAEMKKSSDFCGGSGEASQTVGQSLTLEIDIPYIGTYSKKIDNCEKVLGRVCMTPFSQTTNRRRLLSFNDKTAKNSIKTLDDNGFSKSGSCRIVNAISSFLQFLDCFKNENKFSIDFMPLNAVFDWPFKLVPLHYIPCKDCQIVIVPMDYTIGPTVSSDSIWGSMQPFSNSDSDSSTVDYDFEIGPWTAVAFGEPHILGFSGQSILANEIGDFHLIKLESPVLGSDHCLEQGSLNEDEWGLGKELEGYQSLSKEFMGAQIRFLPGAWDPDMTMSVALVIKISNEEIEIRQLLNEPHYDVKILINGLEYNNNTILNGIKINKIAETVLKGDSGTYIISSRYFTIQWSPFSVSVSLSTFITNTGRNGNGCAIRSEGLVGSWETQSMRYRFGNVVSGELDSVTIKNYVNSWRLYANESIISDWMPLYSTNSSTSFDPPVINATDLSYINARLECLKVSQDVLGKQLDLLNKSCLNLRLKKLGNMISFFVDGCAYDFWLTQNKIFIENLRKHLNLLKLNEPIGCFAPIKILAVKEINTTNSSLLLKIFDSSITEELLQIEKYLNFSMGFWLDKDSNVDIRIFNDNGSILINMQKEDNYSIKIAGAFEKNDYFVNFIDKQGNFNNEPGIAYADILVRYSSNEQNNYLDKIIFEICYLALIIMMLL